MAFQVLLWVVDGSKKKRKRKRKRKMRIQRMKKDNWNRRSFDEEKALNK